MPVYLDRLALLYSLITVHIPLKYFQSRALAKSVRTRWNGYTSRGNRTSRLLFTTKATVLWRLMLALRYIITNHPEIRHDYVGQKLKEAFKLWSDVGICMQFQCNSTHFSSHKGFHFYSISTGLECKQMKRKRGWWCGLDTDWTHQFAHRSSVAGWRDECGWSAVI